MQPGPSLLAPRVRKFVSNRIKLKQVRHKAPIFGALQYRSALGMERLLESGKFRNPDPIITTFNGLMDRVLAGMSGSGTPSWRVLQRLMTIVPHEATLLGGPVIHIPQDIGGGLDDALRDEGRLPDGEDYRDMYGPVRASLLSVAQDLLAQVGTNTMSTAINLNEGIIKTTGWDPTQSLRDYQFSRRGGVLAEGLPGSEIIELALKAIREHPDTTMPIFDINNSRGSSNDSS